MMTVKMQMMNFDVVGYPEVDALNTLVNTFYEDNNQILHNSLAMIAVELLASDDSNLDSVVNSERGYFFIDTLVKSNNKFADTIKNSQEITKLIAQILLEKLAATDALSFEFCTTIINKLCILDMEDSNRRLLLLKFFKSVRSEMVRNETKNLVNNNGQLIGWMNTLEYQAFDGIDYPSLEIEEKIVCLASDFYEVTSGNWSITDLLNLKTAMSNIDLMPKEKTSYIKIMGRMENTPSLIEKVIGSNNIDISNRIYGFTILKFLWKLRSLQDEESFIVDAIYELLFNNGIQCNREQIVSDLALKYASGSSSVNTNVEFDAFDVLIELIYNIKQKMA